MPVEETSITIGSFNAVRYYNILQHHSCNSLSSIFLREMQSWWFPQPSQAHTCNNLKLLLLIFPCCPRLPQLLRHSHISVPSASPWCGISGCHPGRTGRHRIRLVGSRRWEGSCAECFSVCRRGWWGFCHSLWGSLYTPRCSSWISAPPDSGSPNPDQTLSAGLVLVHMLFLFLSLSRHDSVSFCASCYGENPSVSEISWIWGWRLNREWASHLDDRGKRCSHICATDTSIWFQAMCSNLSSLKLIVLFV